MSSVPSSSLSSVVSNLVRASMGSSVSPTVTDEDLDRHVAELILKEAKKKAERYQETGIRAYLAPSLCVLNCGGSETPAAWDMIADHLADMTPMHRGRTSASCPRSLRAQMTTIALYCARRPKQQRRYNVNGGKRSAASA